MTKAFWGGLPRCVRKQNMTEKIIDIRDYAGEIVRAMRPGIPLTTKVGEKANCYDAETVSTYIIEV